MGSPLEYLPCLSLVIGACNRPPLAVYPISYRIVASPSGSITRFLQTTKPSHFKGLPCKLCHKNCQIKGGIELIIFQIGTYGVKKMLCKKRVMLPPLFVTLHAEISRTRKSIWPFSVPNSMIFKSKYHAINKNVTHSGSS